jgi:hypothetical protein
MSAFTHNWHKRWISTIADKSEHSSLQGVVRLLPETSKENAVRADPLGAANALVALTSAVPAIAATGGMASGQEARFSSDPRRSFSVSAR